MDDNGFPLWADFGLAGISDAMTDAAATTTSLDGSVRWSAPELLDPDSISHKRTRASDIYALGGLAIEVKCCFISLFRRLPSD